MATPVKLKKRCIQLGLAACTLAALIEVQAQAPTPQVQAPPRIGMTVKETATQFDVKELTQKVTNWKMELSELNAPNQYPARLIDQLPYRDNNNNKVPDSLE
ncbi:hypothetical protein [Teredinibacter sp. KSP-S5-2]|uniref:hypothetical protein n=1 Tax=Teredinibacter sp. KSP-S5-2 TaxID=3034506 RepID=UPI0029341799|nr:hypothetical protein [Teredinibacter sp. KSP-S5-2]WNO07924.1 hypothetical protein P5V12_13150 [Teredinibacter sp. KSP-S5-2]